MNILIVCNNFNDIHDGIGCYSKKMYDEFKKMKCINSVLISTGFTRDTNKIKMFFSMAMTGALINAIKIIKKKNTDVIIFEYPFQEYNPLIIPFISILSFICKKEKILFVASVHEYLRANKLRQLVIQYIVKHSSMVLVSDENTKIALSPYHNKIDIRPIFSNIYSNKLKLRT